MVDIRQHFNLPVDETFVLAEHPTLNHMIGYIQRMQGGEVSMPPPAPVVEVTAPAPEPVVEASKPAAAVEATPVSDEAMTQQVIDVVVKHTGYPADYIELDQDLEGELGIDTVKQAEIMVDIRELFSLPVDEDFLLSEHPTLSHMIGYIVRMKGGGSVSTPSMPGIEEAPAPAPAPHVEVQSAPMVSDAGIESCQLKWLSSTPAILQISSKWTKIWKENLVLIRSSKQKLWLMSVKSSLYRSMKTSCFPIIPPEPLCRLHRQNERWFNNSRARNCIHACCRNKHAMKAPQ